MTPLRIFIGYDSRQPLAYNVAAHSIARHSSAPVAITPLIASQLPINRFGLTEFTFSRYLVPWLCNYEGRALFVDPDIAVTGDVAELFDAKWWDAPVNVMQEQARFEWPSVMLFNCELCRDLVPEFVNDPRTNPADLEMWSTRRIGGLLFNWNRRVGTPGWDQTVPGLWHYTEGIPCWYETQGLPEDQHWHAERKALTHSVSWAALMGRSVHAKAVIERMLSRLKKASQP